MAKKIAPARKSRSTKVVAAAAVCVASLVGYDPCMLLAPPATATAETVHELSPQEFHLLSNTIELAELDVELSHVPVDAAVEEALEMPATEVPATTMVQEAPAAVSAAEAFATHFAGFDAVDVGMAVKAIGFSFGDRAGYEALKNPDNSNIHRTLRKASAELSRPDATRVLLACGVDERFVDRQSRDGARYNVYAIDKVADLVSYLAGNVALNRINAAVLRSLFRFEAAELAFTGEMAKAAASDKIRVEPRFRPHLVSHTVSASTAPTQASSTMQALVTLGIVRTEGSGRNPVYRLTGSLATKALRERLAA